VCLWLAVAEVWLPDVVAHLAGETRRAQADLDYIVVDEIDEDVAVLLIEPWPRLDERGRLRFGDEDERVSVEVHIPSLRERLTERAATMELTPADRAAFAERPIRVGDAFAGRVDRHALGDETGSLAFLVGPVVDITREAREAAKAQQYATAAPVLSEDEVAELLAPEDDEGTAPS
jgi:hypothetical protein